MAASIVVEEIDVETQMLVAATAGDLIKCKELFGRGACIHLAVIGASNGKQKEVGFWALENGGCFIFSFQHTATAKTAKSMSMLKGPGEVKRGTFKKDT